jgi:hypothetical protein
MFRHIPYIKSNRPKPDLLHTLQISMLHHLQKLMFHFMKTHEWRDKYKAIWLSRPAYHNLTPMNKSYKEVSQWNGKEMKDMSWHQLGVVTQPLRAGSPAQCSICNCTMECTRALLDFYNHARYTSHNDATLSYMEDVLHRFHTFKDGFYSGEPAKG